MLGYHWDCTDWMPPQDLDHIPEVPQYEVPDSPTNISTNTGLNNDYVTEDEYVGGDDTDYPIENGDSDDDNQFAQAAIDFQQQLENYPPSSPPPVEDDYAGYSIQRYRQHPNQYLPPHRVSNSTIPPDYEDNIDDGLPYPQRSFTANRSNNNSPPQDSNSEFGQLISDGISHMDNLSMSIYTSTNASCSDVSGLCDPESEYNSGDDEDEDDDEPNETQAMLQKSSHTDV